MCSNYLSIDVPFSSPVITTKASSIILRTVIEFLAFYKKQIPFPYDTFKLMTTKIKRQISEETSDGDDLLHMQIERQQRLAIDTFNNFKIMLENVASQLDKVDCHQALILYGATSLTPKEAFLINLPSITKFHHSINHQDSNGKIAKAITMSILTSQKLYEIESKLSTTNMFVLLNPKKKSPVPDELFQLNEDFHLPRSCKTVIINLKNISDSINTNCCEHLDLYDDVLADYDGLNITDDKIDSLEMGEEMANKTNRHFNDINEAVWYESAAFVRGFKDVLVKGRSIWNS